VERAIATYAEAAVADIETRPINDAFRHPEDPYNIYVAQSRYATQYEQFSRMFPDEQILIVKQSDLLHRRQQTLHRVFRFLGADPEFESPRFEEMVNVRRGKRRRTAIGKTLRTSSIAQLIRRLPPRGREALFRPARRLTSAPIAQQEPSWELRQRLFMALEGEVARLRELAGVDVDIRRP
jgi:hypothetical protein